LERPRMYLDTKSTSSTDYVDLLVLKVSNDAKGVCYFVLSIDPDPNALYQIIVTRLLNQSELELTAIWTSQLPHLTAGVYEGFSAGDDIVIRHKSKTGAVVKSAVSLEFNEVVEERVC